MLWSVILLLLILWALGFFLFPLAGALIHLLLVIAALIFIYQLIAGRNPD